MDRVGGRASTEEIDGFKLNNGAVGLELGGEIEELFRSVGARWLSTEVTGMRIDNDQVAAVTVVRDGTEVVVPTRFVVSNAGPRATIELCRAENLDPGYVDRVRRDQRSAAMITSRSAHATGAS